MSDPSHPPSGWYPVGDSERYWDGQAWTNEVRAPAPPAQGSSAMDVHGLSHQSQPAQQWPPPRPPGTWAGSAPAMPYGYVTPKSPGLSMLASFFIPGLGSIINGDVARGMLIMIGYFVSCLLVIVIIGIFGVVGFWVWGLVDAYQGARLWNARHGIVS